MKFIEKLNKTLFDQTDTKLIDTKLENHQNFVFHPSITKKMQEQFKTKKSP